MSWYLAMKLQSLESFKNFFIFFLVRLASASTIDKVSLCLMFVYH